MILWHDSVRFGENFSDGAILEVILLESRSKSSHLGHREEPENKRSQSIALLDLSAVVAGIKGSRWHP
jgi:hypothetical protein